MLNYGIIPCVCLALALGACGKKPAEQLGAASAEHVDAATQVGVSTGSNLGAALNAPGNYMRGMAGNVGKAEKAADVYGKAAEEHNSAAPE